MNVIFGAGGVAREVAWLIQEIKRREHIPAPTAFVTSDANWLAEQSIEELPVIRESDYLSVGASGSANVYIAIGLPAAKQRVLALIRANFPCSFPNLIHPRVTMDCRPGRVILGEGIIIYPSASLTTDIVIGDFVHINPCVTVAHQVRIGNFCTLCPGSNISGNVTIGSGCFIGAGAIVKEGVSIADNCMIGAGAVVVKTITEPGTWIGIPARRMQY